MSNKLILSIFAPATSIRGAAIINAECDNGVCRTVLTIDNENHVIECESINVAIDSACEMASLFASEFRQ